MSSSYEKQCQRAAHARTVMAAKRAATNTPDVTIIAALQQVPKLTYVEIAYLNNASIMRVQLIAKTNGLTRYKTKAPAEKEQGTING
jgi:hypothetical protein